MVIVPIVTHGSTPVVFIAPGQQNAGAIELRILRQIDKYTAHLHLCVPVYRHCAIQHIGVAKQRLCRGLAEQQR